MLKMTVDDISHVDEPLRDFYEEDGGKYRLKVEGSADTSGLEAKLTTAQKEAIAERKKRQAWEALGKSPDEIKEILASQSKADEDRAAQAGEWDKLKGKLVEKHATEIKARDDKISAMQSTLERHLVVASATAAIAAEKGVPDLLLPHVQRHVRVVEEDGEYAVRIVDAKGEPRIDAKGEPLTITELVREMRNSEVFGRAFDASGNAGSGMRPGTATGGTGQLKRSQMTAEQKHEYQQKHGQAAYLKLPA